LGIRKGNFGQSLRACRVVDSTILVQNTCQAIEANEWQPRQHQSVSSMPTDRADAKGEGRLNLQSSRGFGHSANDGRTTMTMVRIRTKTEVTCDEQLGESSREQCCGNNDRRCWAASACASAVFAHLAWNTKNEHTSQPFLIQSTNEVDDFVGTDPVERLCIGQISSIEHYLSQKINTYGMQYKKQKNNQRSNRNCSGREAIGSMASSSSLQAHTHDPVCQHYRHIQLGVKETQANMIEYVQEEWHKPILPIMHTETKRT
jgi:hypothetical protein